MRLGSLEVCVTGRVEGRRDRGRPSLKLVSSLAKVIRGAAADDVSGSMPAFHGGSRPEGYSTAVR